jgi:hypothetical protein
MPIAENSIRYRAVIYKNAAEEHLKSGAFYEKTGPGEKRDEREPYCSYNK